jgi:hypothetical protein
MVTAIQRQHSCRALADCRKSDSSTVSNLAKIMIFNIVILFIGLGSLMTCTHDLTVVTKTKETTRYCESFGYGGKSALDKHFYRSNGVSVPTKEGSQQSVTFTHVLSGSSTFVSTHAPSGPVLLYPLHVLQATHKQQNPHK